MPLVRVIHRNAEHIQKHTLPSIKRSDMQVVLQSMRGKTTISHCATNFMKDYYKFSIQITNTTGCADKSGVYIVIHSWKEMVHNAISSLTPLQKRFAERIHRDSFAISPFHRLVRGGALLLRSNQKTEKCSASLFDFLGGARNKNGRNIFLFCSQSQFPRNCDWVRRRVNSECMNRKPRVPTLREARLPIPLGVC